jgi:hypothetical protein
VKRRAPKKRWAKLSPEHLALIRAGYGLPASPLLTAFRTNTELSPEQLAELRRRNALLQRAREARDIFGQETDGVPWWLQDAALRELAAKPDEERAALGWEFLERLNSDAP